MEQQQTASVVAGALMTTAEVAVWLQVSSRSVCHLAARGALPHHRVGPFLRFRREEIERFLDEKRSVYGSPTH